MKPTSTHRIGLVLILSGLAGLGMTLAGMLETFESQAASSATGLADGISGSLLPASLGGLLFLAGLVLVLMPWWRALLVTRG